MEHLMPDSTIHNKSLVRIIVLSALFFLLSCNSSIHAGIDTTYFRIKAVQDSVYAGDTVEVDFFIGGTGLLGGLNILKEFEIEVISDTSLMVQDDIQFKLDSTSLESFFGTLISNITTITTIDPVLGLLDIKANSTNLGNGNARIGRGKYIVQDNVAGRQMMPFGFNKAISKDLLGFNNPVKVVVDSVLIINRVQIPTSVKSPKQHPAVKISPNPVRDFVRIEGGKIQQYRLLSIDGMELIPASKPTSEYVQLDLSKLDAGTYILMLQTEGAWNSYKILKK